MRGVAADLLVGSKQGKPMRPDTAQAFDRMAAAARRDGINLIVVSGYRSDQEQARLFAAPPSLSER
jgi:LAS superfamily LD-carboxypeptidase LdcB